MKVVIIGAGITGLCAAMRLKESNLDSIAEITVFEEQLRPGGLLQASSDNGHTWDNGLFLFTKADYLFKLIPNLFTEVEDFSQKVYLDGRLHEFPFRIRELISSQSAFSLLLSAVDYGYSYIKRCLGVREKNLYEWLCYRLTKRLLGQIQLDTYLEKLQGHPSCELSPILGEQRLSHINSLSSPSRIIRNLYISLFRSDGERKVSNLVYPHGYGVGPISAQLAEQCQSKGVKIFYGTKVREIHQQGESGYRVCCEGKAGKSMFEASHVISTIPLNDLVNAYKPGENTDTLKFAADSLEYMDMRIIFFVINRPVIQNRFFVLYSFEKHHKWKRLIAQSLDYGASSVIVEIPFDPRRRKTVIENVVDIVLEQLTEELSLFEKQEISAIYSTTVYKAYPIYNAGYEKQANKIIRRLESDRFRIAGRQGRFRYINSSAAIQTGINAAEEILFSVKGACA